MNILREKQQRAAKKAMISWLEDPSELGKTPAKIECTGEFDLHGLHYYIYKFKKNFTGDWLMGVCGGYEGEELENCGHVFSEMKKYDSTKAKEEAVGIVEKIREYWMHQAKLQEMFEENLKYINSDADPDVINMQFVKSDSRFYLTVGMVDCPTGKIVVSDPLCYLAAGRLCPQLEKQITPGTYPAQVSICRNQYTGIRMCTARLKIKPSTAVRYEKAMPENSTAVRFKEDVIPGFPVDAGMMSFCDASVAGEYYDFIEMWSSRHPGGTHYDDYFADFFADSYKRFPAYQREGGDFIEWANPYTGKRMVMVASGLGDGFYQCFWGFDSDNDVCELIVPMVNPDIFD